MGNLPRGIVFNPQNNKVYVSNCSSDNVKVIDGVTDAVISTITVGDGPTAMFHNPSGNKIYCSNVGAPGPNTPAACTISVIDAVNNTVISTITAGDEPTAFCYSPNNNKIYWVDEWSHRVSVADATKDSVIMTISLGSGVVQPVDLCYNPINERVYTANRLTYNLTVIKDSFTTAGIPSPTIENSLIKIYPNPVDHILYLNEKFSFSVYSLNGKLMYQKAESSDHLDVSSFTSGTYLLVTEKGAIRFVKR
jgi:YVTN family beta-propeller protein